MRPPLFCPLGSLPHVVARRRARIDARERANERHRSGRRKRSPRLAAERGEAARTRVRAAGRDKAAEEEEEGAGAGAGGGEEPVLAVLRF